MTNLIALNLKTTADLFDNLIENISKPNFNDAYNLKNIDLSNISNKSQFRKSISISKDLKLTCKFNISSDKSVDMVSCANITDLPNELLCIVLYYLDFKTIFRLRSTCKKFYELCSLSYLYNKLDLQPYWNMVN